MFDALSMHRRMPQARHAPVDIDSELICAVFADCFAKSYKTLLVGGGEEPLYQPATAPAAYHQIVFRADYAASALHEVAHWCIAGDARRQRVDYGYWYEPDGRNSEAQHIFERVEVRPQALECFFNVAAGRGFQVSIDNLGGEIIDSFPFQLAVWQQVQWYLRHGLPARAEQFRRALALSCGTANKLLSDSVPLSYII